MLDAVPYRGPDGSGVYIRGHVGLGHALNAVTPEDQGVQQPIVSPRTGCAIIADVRLDNRDELLSALGDRLPPDLSDAELMLRGYEAWGSTLVDRLLGDFAFVIWDPRRELLVCARDGSGQRVLFYRSDRTTFAAASEIHQLLQDESVEIAPDEERIRSFLLPINMSRNQKDVRQTFFTGIFTLEAGELLIATRDRVSIRRYWELSPQPEIRYRSDEEYAEHFLALFSKIVQARLRTVHPIGILLSGGLDSSSVACMAHGIYRQRMAENHGFTSYSYAFSGLDCDETALIQDVQAKYGFPGHILEPFRDALLAPLRPSSFVERPGAHVQRTMDLAFGVARQDNTRVMLTGAVADACIYGSRLVFDALLRQRKFRAFVRHFRAFRRVTSEPLRTTLAVAVAAPLAPLPLQRRFMAAYARRALRRTGDRVLPDWIREPYRSELTKQNFEIVVADERARLFANPARHDEAFLLRPPELTRHLAPWTTEIWQPFADRRLHEFSMAIPPDQKYEPHPDTDEFYAGSKWLVRRALHGVLPESIRKRTTKTIFSGWQNRQVQEQWSEYEEFFGPGAKSEIAARGYVDQARFFSRLERIRGEEAVPDLMWVMQLVGLEIWLRAVALPRAQVVRTRVAAGVVAGSSLTHDRREPTHVSHD